MARYLLRRFLGHALLLLIAVNLAWLLAATQLDPRSLYEVSNPPLDPVAIENTLRARNLSDAVPLAERWRTWLGNVVLRWDWGASPRGGDVGDEVGRRIWVSVRLLALGSVLGAALGVAIGAWTATRQYGVSDRVFTGMALIGLSVPSFVVASVLQVLATWINDTSGLRLFEFVGETGARGEHVGAALLDRLQHLLLPTLALTFLGAAFFSRIQRNLMLDALGSDFVRTARAKGLRRRTAARRHALRTALIPTATYFAFGVATLFVGTAFMEIIFSFHGMGEYAVTTILGHDVHGPRSRWRPSAASACSAERAAGRRPGRRARPARARGPNARDPALSDPPADVATGRAPESSVGGRSRRAERRRLMRRRFLRNRTAVAGAVTLAVLVLLAILGPMLSPWTSTTSTGRRS